MLAIPLMKSEAGEQFTIAPLSKYLFAQQCYNSTQLDHDLHEFSNLRSQAVSVTEPSDAGEQLMMSYWSQLTAITPRFPPSVLENEIHLTFPWSDAFLSTNRKNVPSFLFEQAALVWNLGALESLRGGRLDRSSDDGARLAAKHFQRAAGLFEYIQMSLLPQLQGSVVASFPCLCNDSLTLCKKLMLAQAQLCFYEKAVRDRKKDQMKSSIIAKLAVEVHSLYAAASTASRATSLISILDPSWNAIGDFQARSFSGAAEYWQGLASKEAALQKGSGFGEEVARYIRAEQHVRGALDLGRRNSLPSTLTSGSDSLLSAISANRQTALHELNAIYMEAVTSDQALPEIPPVSMVKATTPSAPVCAADIALFAFVLPREVINLLNRFYDSVGKTYGASKEEAEESTQIARSSLSSLGLPMALENAKNLHQPDSLLPAPLWTKIQDIQQRKLVDLLSMQWDDIEKQNKRAETTLTNIEESLADAERKDNMFRDRFPNFLAEKLCRQNDEIRNHVAVFRTALQTAQQNNVKLHDELVTSDLQRLKLSRDELTALFPQFPVDLLELDTSSSGFHSPEMTALEDKLHELASLLEERTRDVEALKAFGTKDMSAEFSSALFRGENLHVLGDKMTAEVDALNRLVKDNISQQDALLAEIIRLNEIFEKQKQSDATIAARSRVVAELETSVAKVLALQTQLTAGQTFYSNLQAQLTTLQQNADENAYTAQWQRQEFEASLTVVDSQPVQVQSQPIAQTNNLANQFAQNVQISNKSGGALPSFAAYPAVTIKQPVAPTVAPVSSPSTPAPAPTPVPMYQYNQSAYAVNGLMPPQSAAAPSVTEPVPAVSSSAHHGHHHHSTNQDSAQPSQYELETKIARVMEMGFPRENVVQALSATNWNEESAVNVLLGVANAPPAAATNGQNSPQPPTKPPKPSGGGFFSWGKK